MSSSLTACPEYLRNCVTRVRWARPSEGNRLRHSPDWILCRSSHWGVRVCHHIECDRTTFCPLCANTCLHTKLQTSVGVRKASPLKPALVAFRGVLVFPAIEVANRSFRACRQWYHRSAGHLPDLLRTAYTSHQWQAVISVVLSGRSLGTSSIGRV